MALIEITDVMDILPHRFPMLLVDRVIECDYKERIVGIKNVTVNEPFFQGHFPGNPVMPGVIQVEAMAQVGGILLNQVTDRNGDIAYFLAIDRARFRKIIRPGDQMRIEVVLLKNRTNMAKLHGQVLVDGELASEADLMFGRKDD